MGGGLKNLVGSIGLVSVLLGGLSYSQNESNLFEIYDRGFPARVGVLYIITNPNIPQNLLQTSLGILRDGEGINRVHSVPSIKYIGEFFTNSVSYYGFSRRDLIDMTDLGVGTYNPDIFGERNILRNTVPCGLELNSPFVKRKFVEEILLQNPQINERLENIEELALVIIRSAIDTNGEKSYNLNSRALGCTLEDERFFMPVAISTHTIDITNQEDSINSNTLEDILREINTTVLITAHEIVHLYGGEDLFLASEEGFRIGCMNDGKLPSELIGIKGEIMCGLIPQNTSGLDINDLRNYAFGEGTMRDLGFSLKAIALGIER